MKVWITRYALTQGIYEADAELSTTPSMVVENVGNGRVIYHHGDGKDWHRTPESALRRAEKLRTTQIASLEKRIKKLQALRFDAQVATSGGPVNG